ncbi:hypothetical protein V8E53_003158 [Lactarius tabidus]
MYFPGEWVETGPSPSPRPNSVNLRKLKINTVPRKYNPSEKLLLEFWDPRRLAQHVSAVMPLDSGPEAVEFILRSHITGSFLVNYTHEIEELISGRNCELTRRIAKVVPFPIPSRRTRFRGDSYTLPELVQALNARFNLCNPQASLVAHEETEEDYDWAPPSASTSDSERRPSSESDPIERATEQPQVETPHPLGTLPQTPTGQERLAADSGRRPSGSNTPGEQAIRSSERERGPRRGRLSTAVVQGCPFLSFGAVLASFRGLPMGLPVPLMFTFSPQRLIERIEETWQD